MLVKRLRLLAIIVITVSLVSCATLNVPLQQNQFSKQPWPQRRSALLQIRSWNIDGAFSVQQRTGSHIANYRWQQKNANYQIALNASLGLYSLVIQGGPGRVTLIENNQKISSATSADGLIYRRLGWRLPISNLQYWIRGLPAPGEHRGQYDVYGHLSQLTQQGWQVTFSRYVTVKKIDLPQVLDVSGYGLKIRIAIKHWVFDTA